MFKRASCENEIAEAMVANLKLNSVERFAATKLSSAIDALASAAETFEVAGYAKEAEEITSLLERFAGSRDFTLEPEERAFFEHLPHHEKERLKKLDVKDFANAVMELRMRHEVEEELERRNKELGQFETLLPRGKQLPASDFISDQPDFIEFKSLQNPADDANNASDVSMHAHIVDAPKSVKAAFAELQAATPKKKVQS